MDKNSIATTALIIFVRNPELGKVKTRLASTIGQEKALAVYRQLLAHTHQISVPLSCRKFVYYADDIAEYDLWNDPGFTKRQQFGNDLGERMSNAFKELFDQGFTQVLIIGSDCYQLQTEILQEAIHFLAIKEVLLGPTFDGGYYLLGSNRFIPELFTNKTWSTDQVMFQTLQDLHQLELSCHLLPKLHDVDVAADLKVNNITI